MTPTTEIDRVKLKELSQDLLTAINTGTNAAMVMSPLLGPKNVYLLEGYWYHKSLMLSFNGSLVAQRGVEFLDCLFEDHVTIWSNELTHATFKNCIFSKDVRLRGGSKNYSLYFNSCNIKGNVTIDGGNYDNLNVSGTVSERIAINEGNFNSLLLGDPYKSSALSAGFIEVECNKINGFAQFANVKCTEFALASTVKKDTEILIDTLEVTNLFFDALNNYGKVRLFNIAAATDDSWIRCIKSNFGPAELCNINFASFSGVSIEDSILINSVFVNNNWHATPIHVDHSENVHELLGIKETYRQIKYAYSKQGDSVQEHRFHGLEMDSYRFTLVKLISGRMKQLQEYFKRYLWQDLATWLVLWLSKLTSNYGQSIWRPIVTLMITATILFSVYVYQGDHTYLYWSISHGPSDILGSFPELIKFASPFRKINEELPGPGFMIDMLMRIISSYCIYNFVRATRRFVK